MRDRERDGSMAAEALAEQDDAVHPDRVHHRDRVLHPPINVTEIVDRNGIGWSDTPRIEHRAPRQAPLIPLGPKMRWMLPAGIDARSPLLHVEQIEIASAINPIRDATTPRHTRVPNRRHLDRSNIRCHTNILHHESDAPQATGRRYANPNTSRSLGIRVSADLAR
jgi:hypothetical protein